MTAEREEIGEAVRTILSAVGEDPERDGLAETWQRRAPEMWMELTAGYREDEKPEMKTFTPEDGEMVAKTGIPFHALCEHHLLPFHGTANVAYVPDGDVVGISKLVRYVRWTARRIQTQERFTEALADGLMDELEPDGVMAVTEAEHMCEAMRGVETATVTTVSAARGVFTGGHDGLDLREEFLTLLND